MRVTQIFKVLIVFLLFTHCSGCAVITVADAAVTVVATSVKVVAKTVETVVDVVMPSSKKEN